MTPNRKEYNEKIEPEMIDRRTFNKGAVAGGFALAAGMIGAPVAYYLKQNGHHHEEHASGHHEHHFDATAAALRMQEQLRHPFHRNPAQWLRDNQLTALPSGFDLSQDPPKKIEEYCVEDAIRLGVMPGTRMLRTPGSGILLTREETNRRTKEIMNAYEMENPNIHLIKNAHEDCGAGLVFARTHHLPEETSDQAAEDEIRERIEELQDLGILASFGQRVPLSTMDRERHAHKAMMGIVCPVGRMHDPRLSQLPASFVGSAHVDEIGHAVDVMLKVASGSHGYKDLLDRFTLLVLRHPGDRRLSERFFTEASNAATRVARERDIRDLQIMHVNHPLSA